MHRFSPLAQFGLSAAIGIGMAVCSSLVYLGIIVVSDRGESDLWCAFLIVLPSIMIGGAIASGGLVRRVANRSWGSMKCLLATPALYLFASVFVEEFIHKQLEGGVWILTFVVLALTWPVTYLAFRIRRRAPKRDPNAAPTCPKCDYNLTGNVSGICPECGTPITSAGGHDSRV